MATIGISPENNEIIERLYETGFFNEEGDVARFAFAYAMKNHLDVKYPDYHAEGAKTKWAYEIFDKDSLMAELVLTFYPEEEDVAGKVQEIINLGLSVIGKKIAGVSVISVSELIR